MTIAEQLAAGYVRLRTAIGSGAVAVRRADSELAYTGIPGARGRDEQPARRGESRVVDTRAVRLLTSELTANSETIAAGDRIVVTVGGVAATWNVLRVIPDELGVTTRVEYGRAIA